MTSVHVDLRKPQRGTTARTPVAGRLIAGLYRRAEEADHFTLVTRFSQVLVDGQALLELSPSDAANAWVIIEDVPDGATRTVAVPSSAGVVQYTDLLDVDPRTLVPSLGDVPAWTAAVAQVQAALDAAEESSTFTIGNTDPAVGSGRKHVWLQTGLSGGGTTLWYDDGNA